MKIGFIGCGNMGGALAGAISRNMENKVYISDNNKVKAEEFASSIGAEMCESKEVAAIVDILFIGVKPNYVLSVAEEIRDSVGENTLIVSMAAGVALSKLTGYFGEDKKIIRIMPNTPVKVGMGVIAWCASERITEADEESFLSAMAPCGLVDKLPENLIDAECAVAGCGPAFAYMFIDALADGAVNCGLPRDKAILYAAETLKDAAEMVAATGEHPEALKDAVCSPGGATIEGVRALENGGLRAACIDAVLKAYEKTKKLG